MLKTFPFLIGIALTAKTIIISADGFRWDYYGRIPTPGIDKIKSMGVHVKNLKNSFATVTFPNHYTLVTGLYEESHGIVDNTMFDPLFNETFDMSTTSEKWWSGGEPIWVSLFNSVGKKSVCVNWVGCGVDGQHPAYWGVYNGPMGYEDRVDRIVDVMAEDDAVDLGLLYFEEPDHSCHLFGPDSQEVLAAIRRVDDAIIRLLAEVDLSEVNVIFTSDHGGVSVGRDRVIVLTEKIQEDIEYRVSASGAVAHIWPAITNEAHSLLSQLSRNVPEEQASCFLKNSVPNRLHYSNNRRIAPIVCIATLGWSIVHTFADRDSFTLKGSHGYDSSQDDDSPMRPIFIAAGPNIIQNDSIQKSFQNVHVFSLLTKLLNMETHVPKTNGTESAIQWMIKPRVDTPETVVVLQW